MHVFNEVCEKGVHAQARCSIGIWVLPRSPIPCMNLWVLIVNDPVTNFCANTPWHPFRLFMSASVLEHAGRISVKDSVYCSIPLYHSHGVCHSVAPMIYSGCTLVIRNKFSASHFWTDCVKYNCTVSLG